MGSAANVDRPLHEIEPVYLEYLAKDTIVTFLLFHELQRRLDGGRMEVACGPQ